VVGGAESDMELDLLGESESDSDESTHSHADNASIQRSAVTAATAGSDAGLSACPSVGFWPTLLTIWLNRQLCVCVSACVVCLLSIRIKLAFNVKVTGEDNYFKST